MSDKVRGSRIRNVAIFDEAGNVISPSNPLDISGTVGTNVVQYTEGDTDATITGTAAMGENGNDVFPLQLDSSLNLEVNIRAADATVTVDGAVEVTNVPATSLVVTPGSGTWDDATVTGTGSTAPINASLVGGEDGAGDLQALHVDASTRDLQVDVTNLGAMETLLSSVIDTNNTTTTPLGGGATYTGTATDVIGYAAVAVTVATDVDSAASGMQFQFCPDSSFGATNTDSHDFNLDASDSEQRRFQFPVTAQYFRVKYTNGGGAQNNFDVQTILHRQNILTSIHRLGNDTTLDRSAELVKALILGETSAGGGGTVNVKVSPSGALEVNAGQGDDPWNCDITANTIGLATQTTLAALLTELALKADLTETQPVAQALDTGWLTIRKNYTAAETNTVIQAGAAGETIHVKHLTVTADNANTVDVSVLIGFDSATTPTGADCVLSHPGIAPGSGMSEFYGEAGVASQTTGDDVLITSQVPTTGSISVVMIYKITS